MQDLQDRLFEGGEPAEITGIEFELLENGRFRWILWSGGRRVSTELGDGRNAGDVEGVLAATGLMIRTMAGVDPQEDLAWQRSAHATTSPSSRN